jgi:hypothetical protein
MYRVIADFHPMDDRHLSAQIRDIVSGVHEVGDWILGFTDDNPDQFGFIPKDYLEFSRVPGSSNRTPIST